MGDYDLYRSRMSAYGSTIKEGRLNSTLNFINSTFEDSPSFFEVKINGDTTSIGVQITDNSSNSNSKIDYIRKIIMKPSDTIFVGDIVEWNSKKWLVITAEQFSDVYWYGMMQECNNTLKYYKNSVLFEVPCVFSEISIDLEEGRIMNLPIGHYTVLIQAGYITKDDTNLRFLLNDAAYKIEGISTATNGLTKIELVDDSIIPDDNRVLGISNYFSNQPTTPTEDSISISPIDSTINKGSTKIFNAIVTIDGVIDDTERTIWIITNKDGTYTPYCLMTYDNRTCTLVASNNAEYVGKVINLKVVLESDENVFVNKEITISSFI